MGYKTYKPITPSLRGTVRTDRSSLWKGGPYKPLVCRISNSGGRNNLGRITIRHRGGGSKTLYRIVDFKRNKFDIPAIVERIEYDPNRNAYIALIKYEDGVMSYILAPQGVQAGDKLISSYDPQGDIDPRSGNCYPLKYIPAGTTVHNIELKPRKGGQLTRAAGSFTTLMGKNAGYATLKLKSGEERKVSVECMATIGTVSNSDHANIKLGKAGATRHLGRRSKVRGVAMNPVDHPLGGGEGKTSGGRHPVSPWGSLAKGKRTRDMKKFSSKYIIKRRTKKNKKK